MQGRHYGNEVIYYGPIFRLTKLAFLRARYREKNKQTKQEKQDNANNKAIKNQWV